MEYAVDIVAGHRDVGIVAFVVVPTVKSETAVEGAGPVDGEAVDENGR